MGGAEDAGETVGRKLIASGKLQKGAEIAWLVVTGHADGTAGPSGLMVEPATDPPGRSDVLTARLNAVRDGADRHRPRRPGNDVAAEALASAAGGRGQVRPPGSVAGLMWRMSTAAISLAA